ncbi:phosphonoacetaldehyde reductase [Streptomyces sp. NPDC056704]|uniref:phosphonoacetaldehyde reductase n=1 Tax=Streptomyces sp. NPDC056704 TaxID=3345917 RepID=UPI0036B33599
MTVPPSTAAAAWAGLQRLPGHPAAYLGRGSVSRLGQALAGLGAERVLVVHGRVSYPGSRAHRVVTELAARHTVEHFGGVRPNPDVQRIRVGVEAVRRFRPHAVVGIGGGSSLDVAKTISVMAAQPSDPAECLRHPELVTEARQCALILLPTTAGSGSEMTRFATVYDEGHKYSFDTDRARADLVIIDQDLTTTLPLRESVVSGLDALSQSIESYWAVAATARSRELARLALEKLLPALARAVGTGSFADPTIRADMAHGASVAGSAIDITRTTAAHALSYALTAQLGLPHGTAVALHLPWLIERHAVLTETDCRHPQGAAAVRRAVADVEDLARSATGGSVRNLVERLLLLGGQPTGIRELALDAGQWREPLTAALAGGRAWNNPCVLTAADVSRLVV